MANVDLIVIATTALAAVVSLGLAYAIGIRGMTRLIQGHDEGTARDERGLARWMGGWLAFMGVCLIVLAALWVPLSSTGHALAWGIGGCVVSTIGAAALALGPTRYR